MDKETLQDMIFQQLIDNAFGDYASEMEGNDENETVSTSLEQCEDPQPVA